MVVEAHQPKDGYCRDCEEKVTIYSEPYTEYSVRWWCGQCEGVRVRHAE